jgi:hypothetical protein
MTGENPEIGRRLKAGEIEVGKVHVCIPPHTSEKGERIAVTMWCVGKDGEHLMMRAGVLHWTVVSFIRDDGEVVDDKGLVVEVYQYLGKP